MVSSTYCLVSGSRFTGSNLDAILEGLSLARPSLRVTQVEKLKVQLNLYERQIALVENVATRKAEAAKQALAESESAGEKRKACV
jgi:hypothetical protein